MLRLLIYILAHWHINTLFTYEKRDYNDTAAEFFRSRIFTRHAIN